MICQDRVVIVTGAGRGLGRAHALAFAAAGAKVVVNDFGANLRGDDEVSQGPADDVVAEIRAAGGEAVAHYGDVADWETGANLVQTAIDTFGDLHVVMNNAGIIRDRMFVTSEESEWDAVMRVHVKGHVCTARHAAAYWRGQVKAGKEVDARIINTSSGAGLQGSIGQSAYSAAKGGIASMTLVQAAELRRYGITSNAIAPIARTRMTEQAFGEMMAAPDEGFDAMHPENVSPLVVWLGSRASHDVTGRVFEIGGGKVNISDGWRPLEVTDKGARWAPEELTDVIARLLERAPAPAPVYGT